MKIKRKHLIIGGVITALAAGGAGIAYGVAGDSEEQASGPGAEKAKSAALKAVGGGTVVGVEREDGDGAGVYEVEVRRADGSQVEVAIDDNYRSLGSGADDDTGGESDGDGEGDD